MSNFIDGLLIGVLGTILVYKILIKHRIDNLQNELILIIDKLLSEKEDK